MSARKTTIATAQKRVIKSEISALQKRITKVENTKFRERGILWKIFYAAQRKLDQFDNAYDASLAREKAPLERRIAILAARLNS
jgi:hypothetical protein